MRSRSSSEQHLYGLGDFHIGHTNSSPELVERAVKIIEKDPHPKRVYLLGDLVEAAAKNVGTSVYHQDLALDDQIETLVRLLAPIRRHIQVYLVGNHEYRLLKEYNLNVPRLVRRSLGCSTAIQHHDTIRFPNKSYRIFAVHGYGAAKRVETAITKISNDTREIDADIVLYGHLHYLFALKKYVNRQGRPEPKLLACTGCFMKQMPDYAQMRLYPPAQPGFVRISVTSDDIDYKLFEMKEKAENNQDEERRRKLRTKKKGKSWVSSYDP